MKITIEDFGRKTVIDHPEAESITDYAWLCFHALLGASCDPQNVCDAFYDVADEIQNAWFRADATFAERFWNACEQAEQDAEEFQFPDYDDEDGPYGDQIKKENNGPHGFGPCPICEAENELSDARSVDHNRE